jgi:hypothetical protein
MYTSEVLVDRVEQPRMTYAVLGVARQLLFAREPLGRWRQHLAHPIGYEREVVRVRELRHALEPPSREIRDGRLLEDELQLMNHCRA